MNRIFKVVFSKVLGRHVVASEFARSCTKKGAKAVVAAAMAVMGLGAFADVAVAQEADVDPTNASVSIGKDNNGKYYIYQQNQKDVHYYIAGASGGGVMTESYEGTQTVTEGSSGTGSTEFTIMNVATGNTNPIGTMAIKAGDGITISQETVADITANGKEIERQIAVISAASAVNTYTTKGTFDSDSKKITFTGTNTPDGTPLTYDVDLGDVALASDIKTYGLETASGDNAATVTLTDGSDTGAGTVTVAGGENVTVSAENGNITISAENTYTQSGAFDTTTKQITFTRNDQETYDVDLSGVALASDVKTYSGQQKTVSGSDFGDGSTKFTIYEKSGASETPAQDMRVTSSGGALKAVADNLGTPVGEMNIVAGENVMIEQGDDGVTAKISAKDTTYSFEVGAGEGPGQVSKLTVTDDTAEEIVAEFYDTDTRNTVVAGNNITVEEETNPDDGSIAYTIHGKDTKVTSEDSSVTVKETVDEATGVTTYDLAVSGGGGASEFEGDDAQTVTPAAGKLTIKGGADAGSLTDNNIGVVADGENGLKVKLAKDIKNVDTIQVNKSVTVGNTTINKDGMTIKGGPTVTSSKVDMAGQRIQNIGAGTADTDAVNVAQLKQSQADFDQKLNHLNGRIGEVAQDANAGIAMALAAASLPQAYLPGKSMMAIAGGTYRGEQGYAIGFSTVTDDGKWIIKANASGNTQGHYGAAVGAGYMW
ncbi:MAG: YadA-like family protein [Oxalobacter sp.]|nr:YadA-like family protein [Oxalobacter sp.]